jgi:3-dehydrosphinganine reductase
MDATIKKIQKMNDHFHHKNILITGGSSGIGLALAKQLTELGSTVWILGTNREKLENAIKDIDPTSSRIFQADVTIMKELQGVYDYFRSKGIRLDVLINSAGVAQPGEFEEQEIDLFHWMMNINYFGTVNAIKSFLPLMDKGSNIVNISSMAAILGIYGYTAYSASKYAVRGFSDALRSELRIKGISVSIVFPPDTQTPQLDHDNKYKPKITKELSSTAGVMTAENVAKSIILGIKSKKYIIIPGMESKFIYWASNLLGSLTFPVVDMLINSAIKKIKNQQSKVD